jgi:PqqD family protein of HPr-rel-A system
VTITSASQWTTVPDLIWTHFEDSDEYVVFHPESGDIHLLTHSAQRLWHLVADRMAATIDDLAAQLATDLGREPDAQLISATRETLDFMDQAGLIRPLSR